MKTTENRLDRLLRPRSVAVIGGGNWCREVVSRLREMRFAGDVWCVHPTRSEVSGLPAIPSVDHLPHPPDAAFVGVNRHATIDVIERLSSMGAGGAVCFASGFSELSDEHGLGLTEALLRAAKQMPFIGPNCYGLINALDGAALWPDIHGLQAVESGVAILTQSSNIALNLSMQRRGLPIAYVVTAGNQTQTGLAEIGAALLDDPRVTALGLHVEGFGDVAAIERLAWRARALGKPIVALKVGRSDAAQSAALTHTASLAGSDAGAEALLQRLGIARVGSLEVLLEALKLLHVAGPLQSPTLASMSCSGGEASLMADAGDEIGIGFPPLTPDQAERLRDVLGPMVSLSNPLDYHTFIWGQGTALQSAFETMLEGPAALLGIVVDFPRADRCKAPLWDVLVDAALGARAKSSKPLALIASLPDTMPEELAERLIAAGVVPLCGIETALQAIRAAAMPARVDSGPRLWPVRPVSATALMAEPEAKALLSGYGVAIPKGAVAETSDRAAAIARDLSGKVVLKTVGDAHKSDTGGVVLNLLPGDVESAATTMGQGPWLVEQMVEGAVVELLVGVLRDPAHGFVLTLGAGGTLAEILADTISLLLPVSAEDIRRALLQLRIAPLLHGYRGKPKADMEALVQAIMAVQRCVEAHRDALVELEINPLVALPEGAVAVDALARIAVKKP